VEHPQNRVCLARTLVDLAREENMLQRIALAAVVVLGLAAPSDPSEQVDPQMRQAAENLAAQWQEAINRGDTKAAAALFAPDAVEVNVYGRQTGHEIEEEGRKVHEMGVKLKTTVEEVKPLASGQMMLVTGTFQVSYTDNPTTRNAHGNWLRLMEKQGSTWKIIAQSLTRQAQPVPAVGSSTAPRQ
jgi:uncharacterized protein (TIGR02246 family)